MVRWVSMVDCSIVIPCYNEARRLPATLYDIAFYLNKSNLKTEVIVVDDGSTDDTRQIVERLQPAIPQLRLVHYADNQGKGHAVRRGMLVANGTCALFMDADNATQLAEIEKLLPYLGSYDVVIGSRYLAESNLARRQPWYRLALGRLGNAVIRRLLVPGVYDTQCGFKLFSRSAYRTIFVEQKLDGFGFDIEVLSLAGRLGYGVKEVGITWRDAPGSKVRPFFDTWRTLSDLLSVRRRFRIEDNRIPIAERFA